MNQRCKTFMQKFDALGIDAALVSSYENVRYLSGFTNTETLLVLDAKEQWLLTDSRYSEQAEKQCPDFTVIKTGHGVSLATELKKRNEDHGIAPMPQYPPGPKAVSAGDKPYCDFLWRKLLPYPVPKPPEGNQGRGGNRKHSAGSACNR